jgi:serine/threonine-protein kinase RIO1
MDPDSDHKLNTYACKAKPLGEGTYATVYQATATDGKQYAVKVFFFERFA